MKKQISIALLGLALTFALGVAASAQGARAIRIQVPFDFAAGERRMPAGRYTVGRVRADAGGALLIRSEEGGGAAVVLTNAGEAPTSRASMTFRQYGESYFLAEVSMPGADSVREVPKGRGERSIEQETAEEAGEEVAAKRVMVVGSVR